MEYESHKAASLAKRRLSTGRIKVWGCDIIVDWADPQEEPDEQTMSKVNECNDSYIINNSLIISTILCYFLASPINLNLTEL